MRTKNLVAVDDRQENLFVLEELISEYLPDCSLTTAQSAEEGLALAAVRSFDGALIDVQMPGTDGVEMCRRLKADEANGHLPILLITAHHSTTELRIRGLEAGADDFISRPIDIVELVAKIKVMLRIKRAEDELREINAHLNELVTERTSELRESRQRFKTLADTLPQTVFECDADGKLTYVNRRAFEAFGYTAEDFENGLHVVEMLSPEDRDRGMRMLAEAVAGNIEPNGREYLARRKDGSTFPVVIYSSPVARGKQPAGLRGIIVDVTERKRAEEELAQAKEAAEAANRAKSTFLANMSHEIRTPMTAILGFSDLLMSYDCPPSERREHLQTIHRNATNLLTLINDILDVSKIEAEKIELEPCDCSPRQIVEDVRSLLQFQATEKNLGLDAALSYPLPETIHTDPTRLRQILVNLVGNAIKFTQTGGVKIRVRLVQPEDVPPRMEFEVTDTGVGMSEEEIGRLFQPFTQADASNTRRFGGSGLGLHISKKLADMLGGQIEVWSEPGVGSTFTLAVDPGPLENVEMQTSTPTSAKEEKPAKAGQKRKLRGRVLLAEDVEDMRWIVRINLEMLGLEVDDAENGRIALEKASASKAEGRPYDLILMDVQMPELNGLDATRCLRQDGWKGPIVALTALAMKGDDEMCLEAGCDDYISKPMTVAELFDTIARHLGKATPGPSAESVSSIPT